MRRLNLSYKRKRPRCIRHNLKSRSLKSVGGTGDGLGVVFRKHSSLIVRDHSFWCTTSRKVRVILHPRS